MPSDKYRQLYSSTWHLPCVSCGRKLSPSAGCLTACGDHLVFSAAPLDSCSLTRLACTGGLSREIEKQFEVSTREVVQVGPVAVSGVSSVCSCPCNVCLVAEQILSVQHEAQKEKLPSNGLEQRLRVNSQFGKVNATSIINNPTAKEKMLCYKWSCGTGKWQAKLKFHTCCALTTEVLWYTPSNAAINSLVI